MTTDDRRLVYVAVTRAGSEQVVVEDLRDRGFAAWSPMQVRWVSEDGRRRRQTSALLPRYAFVASSDIVADFDAIRHARRVSAILGRDGKPAPICARWVFALLTAQTFGAFDRTAKRPVRVSVGQTVRVVSGHFKGTVGRLAQIKDQRGTVALAIGGLTQALENLEPVT